MEGDLFDNPYEVIYYSVTQDFEQFKCIFTVISKG